MRQATHAQQAWHQTLHRAQGDGLPVLSRQGMVWRRSTLTAHDRPLTPCQRLVLSVVFFFLVPVGCVVLVDRMYVWLTTMVDPATQLPACVTRCERGTTDIPGAGRITWQVGDTEAVVWNNNQDALRCAPHEQLYGGNGGGLIHRSATARMPADTFLAGLYCGALMQVEYRSKGMRVGPAPPPAPPVQTGTTTVPYGGEVRWTLGETEATITANKGAALSCAPQALVYRGTVSQGTAHTLIYSNTTHRLSADQLRAGYYCAALPDPQIPTVGVRIGPAPVVRQGATRTIQTGGDCESGACFTGNKTLTCESCGTGAITGGGDLRHPARYGTVTRDGASIQTFTLPEMAAPGMCLRVADSGMLMAVRCPEQKEE